MPDFQPSRTKQSVGAEYRLQAEFIQSHEQIYRRNCNFKQRSNIWRAQQLHQGIEPKHKARIHLKKKWSRVFGSDSSRKINIAQTSEKSSFPDK